MLGDDEKPALVRLCCSQAMAAHCSPSSPFLIHRDAPSAAVFAFPASWSSDDWLIAGARSPFGETEVDASIFPSIKALGSDTTAAANGAFLRTFVRLLATSRLREEVLKALDQGKRIVYTGHSSGGAIAILATIWFLEQRMKDINRDLSEPLCVTFGSPLIGDDVFAHALQRENWCRCFVHFVMTTDVIPRCLFAPLSSFREQFQAILHVICSRSFCYGRNAITKQLATFFHDAVLRSGRSVSDHQACSFMGCTNPLLEVLGVFVKLTPYRPFGAYFFLCSNGQMVSSRNSNSTLQMLFYTFQLGPEEDVTEAAFRSIEDHLLYGERIKGLLDLRNMISVEALCSSAQPFNDKMETVTQLLEDVDLSREAVLCLRSAEEWENQRVKNQAAIDSNYKKIQECIDFLKTYRDTCEMRGLGYYDAFKLQKDTEDFNANVKRLELAGLWDEIIEMLRRHELPDGFEGLKKWVSLGTTYRQLVEPLDIANYYRHSKNEDTGPYLVKGRPRRYRYTQKWLEHAERLPTGSSMESCFWALVEELCMDASNNKPYLEMRSRILELETMVQTWIAAGKLGKDFLLCESTFSKWWMALPKQHRLESSFARLMNGGELEMLDQY